MAEWKKTRCGFIAMTASIVIYASLSAVAVHAGQAASGGPPDTAVETQNLASLHIEGQGIEQLILRDEEGRHRTFDQPGSTVTLPPGNYSIHSIRLQGDHYAQSHLIPRELRVVVEPNAPATLKAGAPLQQVVTVERQGPVMALRYELIGQGGESYAINRNEISRKPAFIVYRGDRKVASGDFEFG